MSDASLSARIDAAVDLIVRIASGDIEARGEISPREDALDALVMGLNMLAEELHAETAARRRAEALLADERDAYEEAPALFCSVNLADLTILKCNRTLARTLGAPKEQLVGRSILSLCREDSRGELEALLRELTSEAPVTGRELTLEAAGRTLVVAASATRVTGDVAGDRARVILQDVTTRVQLHAEHERLKERYLQSQKMEAIGRLAGGVAHDFNNALTVITLSAQFARHAPADAALRSIDHITQAAKHAAELTRQLLAFSRKQILNPVVVDLDALIQRMHPMLARLLGEDVILRTRPSGTSIRISADPGQLEQVVLNLAVNARDAMPDGGELLIENQRVQLNEAYTARHTEVPPGTYAMLAVSDTGHGMSPEVREKIFEPFFSTKALGHGTGLGLATVLGIVQQSDGRIEVYSEPGKGTSFKLYFPLVDAEAEAAPASAPPSAEVVGGRETILLVEDDALVRHTALESLNKLGYVVLVATAGAEALALADAHAGPIHLVLTDVVMPGMNGRDLVVALTKRRPEIKALYASGFTENVIAQHGVLEPGVQFLAKPYTFEALAERVRAVLDG